ncbi:MAG: DUF559 domain-containing protein [Patescibacteria group bacterium]
MSNTRRFSYRDNIDFRRKLRKEPTKAEKFLWPHLNNRRCGGLKFRRQHGIGKYIVDFYHAETKTVIEIDGDVHFALDGQVEKDATRESWLRENGFNIMRFNNVDIFDNLDGVLSHIYHNLSRLSDGTSPCPLLGGEG